jgi:two-component system chemotaxis sensor kinase CheA
LLVEDSQFIRNGVKLALQRVGYHVTEAQDGAEAMTILEKSLSNPGQAFKVMVTDIEMPRMDGLTLTRKVREHPGFSELPILFHTSLSGKANQAAGHAVGANGYVIKNDFSTLFELLKEICGEPSNAWSA